MSRMARHLQNYRITEQPKDTTAQVLVANVAQANEQTISTKQQPQGHHLQRCPLELSNQNDRTDGMT
jgi:Tfp pilus assembly major pilin PilA